MSTQRPECFEDLDEAGQEQYVHGVLRFYHEFAKMVEEHAVWNPEQRTLYDEGFGYAAYVCSQAIEQHFGVYKAFKS